MRMSALNRRAFLTGLGCTAAASPLLTPVTFANGTWDNRLVVIILRGGMDGLDTLRPYGDRDFASLKGRADQAQIGGGKILTVSLGSTPRWRG